MRLEATKWEAKRLVCNSKHLNAEESYEENRFRIKIEIYRSGKGERNSSISVHYSKFGSLSGYMIKVGKL